MRGEFEVGAWRVFPTLNELEGPDGERVRVEPKSMAVLLALAEDPGEVRTRQELLDKVWGETIVTEEVLSHAIWNLRRSFGDSARKPTVIQTIPRTGYRLIAPVHYPDPDPELHPEVEVVPVEPQPELISEQTTLRSYPPVTSIEALEDLASGSKGFGFGKAWWIGLLLATVVGAVFLVGLARESAEPLRVAVSEPERVGTSAELGSSVEVAVLNTLASLSGVLPLDQRQIGEPGGGVLDVARAVAADEVVEISISPIAENTKFSWLTLYRYSGVDGRVLWSDAFEIPHENASARLLADTVRVRLQRAFPDHRGWRDSKGFEVEDEDYTRFLALLRRFYAGEKASAEDLEILEEMLVTSPRFLEGYLFAIRIAERVYRDTRDVDFVRRGLDQARRAEEVAPEDPRPRLGRFELELARGQFANAEQILSSLEDRLTGAEPILAKARLHEAQGNLEAAVLLRQQLADLWPSWTSLYELARLEQSLGRVDRARMHLESLLERAPGNPGIP